MRITIFIDKSVHENAAYYYELAKEARKKAEKTEKAIEETKKAIEEARKKTKEKKVRVRRKRGWYETFHYFFTSGGRLAVGGRTAEQNDLVFMKHMEKDDLFFHADIQGGSAVILKDGVRATEAELMEAAQFAASFSNAWKNGNAAVDVYAARKEQVAKHAHGGYVAAGAFAITGERMWFRNVQLGLRIVRDGDVVKAVPLLQQKKFDKEAKIYPSKGGKEKSETAKFLSRILGTDEDEIMRILPPGKTIAKKD